VAHEDSSVTHNNALETYYDLPVANDNLSNIYYIFKVAYFEPQVDYYDSSVANI
jgi:hypothetical protein